MKNLIRLFFFLFSSLLFSQQSGNSNFQGYANMNFKVLGIVSDSETGEPLEYATISIISKNNPEKIFGGLTDQNGKFSVNVNPGLYDLKIDYISFISYSNENLMIRGNTDIGNISNLRITRTAVYKTNFTVPKFKLKEIPGTILLCCQSSSSTTEATVSVPGTLTANGDPTATAFGPGLKEDITDTGVVFDGVTTFDSQIFMVPPSGKTTERNRGRGLVGGGWSPSLLAQIYSVEIQSDGTSADFGDLTDARRGTGAAASATRAVWAGGYSPGYVDVMDFVTIASTANALDFGNLDFGRFETSGLGNDTRGVFGPSENPAQSQNVIQFITFATTGNATDFGDSTVQTKKQASMNSTH